MKTPMPKPEKISKNLIIKTGTRLKGRKLMHINTYIILVYNTKYVLVPNKNEYMFLILLFYVPIRPYVRLELRDYIS